MRTIRRADVRYIVNLAGEDILDLTHFDGALIAYAEIRWPNENVPQDISKIGEWVYNKIGYSDDEKIWQFWADMGNTTEELNKNFWDNYQLQVDEFRN